MRRVVLTLVLLLVLVLTGSQVLSLAGSQPTKAGAEAKNVIIIIWDGTQRSHLLEMLARHELPNLQKLIDETHTLGLPVIDSETCEPGSGDGYRTQTGPANSAIVTGLGYPGMANQRNNDPRPIPDGLTLWEWIKEERGYATGIISSKNAKFWPLPALTNARNEIDYWEVKRDEQQWVTDKALEFIQAHVDDSFLVYVHLRDPDVEGHRYGENSRQYTEAIVVDDNNLGQLIQKLQELGIKEETIIILTTDHGFEEKGYRHGKCVPDTKDLFLVTSGNGVDLLGCVHTQTDIMPCVKNLFVSRINNLKPGGQKNLRVYPSSTLKPLRPPITIKKPP